METYNNAKILVSMLKMLLLVWMAILVGSM